MVIVLLRYFLQLATHIYIHLCVACIIPNFTTRLKTPGGKVLCLLCSSRSPSHNTWHVVGFTDIVTEWNLLSFIIERKRSSIRHINSSSDGKLLSFGSTWCLFSENSSEYGFDSYVFHLTQKTSLIPPPPGNSSYIPR